MNGPIIYDEWKPKDYMATKWQRLVVWICEKMTGYKIIALYRPK